jgi:hypothetical protein
VIAAPVDPTTWIEKAEPGPLSHIAPEALVRIEAAQLVEQFEHLDDYGRRVAMAMMRALTRLAAARSGGAT